MAMHSNDTIVTCYASCLLLIAEEAGRDYEYIAHYMRELVGPEYVHAGVSVGGARDMHSAWQ